MKKPNPVIVNEAQGVRYYTIRLSSAINRREAEKKAVRLLVGEAFGPEAVYEHADNGAPMVRVGDRLYKSVSVSHSRIEAVLVVAEEGEYIGVDLEEPRQQLFRVCARVFSTDENKYYTKDIYRLLQAWTLKEALYKAHGNSEIDFRRDIILPIPDIREEMSVQGVPYSVVMMELNAQRCLTVVRRSLGEGSPEE